MAQVEVGLRAVVEHVHLAVLKGTHRARIDIQVGIELLDAYRQAAHLQEGAERPRREPFAQRRNDASRDENITSSAKEKTRRSAIHKKRLNRGDISARADVEKVVARPLPRPILARCSPNPPCSPGSPATASISTRPRANTPSLAFSSNIKALSFPVMHPYMVWFLTITDVPARHAPHQDVHGPRPDQPPPSS